MKKAVWLSWLFLNLVLIVHARPVMGESMKIDDGKVVKFDYTLKIDGQAVETSIGKAPLEYTHGEGTIIPGLSSRIKGLAVGDEKTVLVPAKEAYGEIDDKAYREVSRTTLPEGFEPQPGMVIELQAPDGNTVPAVVWEVKDETIVLNFNHPLAGKTLEFDIKIVDIK